MMASFSLKFAKSLFIILLLAVVKGHQDLSAERAVLGILKGLEPVSLRYEKKETYYMPLFDKLNTHSLAESSEDVSDKDFQNGRLDFVNKVYGEQKRGIQALAKNGDFPRRIPQQPQKEVITNYSYPYDGLSSLKNRYSR